MKYEFNEKFSDTIRHYIKSMTDKIVEEESKHAIKIATDIINKRIIEQIAKVQVRMNLDRSSSTNDRVLIDVNINSECKEE